MKIREVRAHVLRSPLAEPFAFSQGWVRQRSTVLVEVTTDEGVTGWGEALCQGLQPPEIAAATVGALRALVEGDDPLQPEVLWHRLYHHTRDYGMKGAVIGAISGIDIALWDIAGKVRGASVAELLGGRFRGRVQAYATGFYRITGPGEAARLADEARRHLASGFRLLKVKLGFGIDDDLVVMRAIRAATQADGYAAMIDTNHAYGVAEAIRLGRELWSRTAGGCAGTKSRSRPKIRTATWRCAAPWPRRSRAARTSSPSSAFASCSRAARSTSRSPASVPRAASPAAGTSSHSRMRTACRSIRMCGPPARAGTGHRSEPRSHRALFALNASMPTRKAAAPA
jgi:hypothetical protein